jgi:beta-xylosidase
MKLLSSVLVWVPSVLGAASSMATFNQPVLWEDLADLDIFRVGNKYYYSASTMHYSPGAPILESYDLVNWEYIGHSVPSLDWSSKYSLANGSHAYNQGVWASSLRYRPGNSMWYWIGCIEFNKTYIYTASSPQGPWTKSGMINTCYYDCGLLIDDDDIMYAVYGRQNIYVAQLSADVLSEVKSEKVFSSKFYIEGSRFYKVNGTYYIFNTKPPNAEWVLQGSSPFGPFTQKLLLQDIPTPVPGAGIPHQVIHLCITKVSIKHRANTSIFSFPKGRHR